MMISLFHLCMLLLLSPSDAEETFHTHKLVDWSRNGWDHRVYKFGRTDLENYDKKGKQQGEIDLNKVNGYDYSESCCEDKGDQCGLSFYAKEGRRSSDHVISFPSYDERTRFCEALEKRGVRGDSKFTKTYKVKKKSRFWGWDDRRFHIETDHLKYFKKGQEQGKIYFNEIKDVRLDHDKTPDDWRGIAIETNKKTHYLAFKGESRVSNCAQFYDAIIIHKPKWSLVAAWQAVYDHGNTGRLPKDARQLLSFAQSKDEWKHITYKKAEKLLKKSKASSESELIRLLSKIQITRRRLLRELSRASL